MTYAAYETSVYSGQPVEFYHFTRGTQHYLYTSADTSQEHLGLTYAPEVITRDAVDQSNEDSAGSITITVPRDCPVAALFIAYLPIEPVGITVYRKHRPDAETIPIFIGKVASAAFDGSEAQLLAMPIGEVLRRSVPGIVFQAPCNHALYGPGCTLNKESFKVVATVGSVVGDTITAPEFASLPSTHLKTGFIKRNSTSDIRFIVGHTGTTITLMNPFPDLAPGEGVTAYWGCDRTENTCETKFNNLPNHMGWARIPSINPFNTDLSGMGTGGSAGNTTPSSKPRYMYESG